MNQPDPSQTEELQQIACARNAGARIVAPEQLRRWLCDRRSQLKKERVELLTAADRLKQEIAAYDQLLAELTTG